MTDREVESVAYPGPGSRPFRRDLDPIAPHVIVLFGCTGDLAKRKLLPGLAYLAESALAPAIRIVGTAMEDMTTEEFRELAHDAVQNYGMHRLAESAWKDFAARLTYVPQGAGPEGLTSAVKEAQSQLGDGTRLLHYLSVPPKAAQAVLEMLRDADLTGGARVIMEKPFGHDFESAVRLNRFVHDVFDESQVFRIDHFLGKEAAQNILAFRFANGLFEPIWNRNFIDHIQIDIPEELGLDTRANFYEATGAF
jgi:glucose-6-phosphate 1-dehydrogenase